ncbi:hypothetical protein IAG41_16955 [Sphingomonas sp. JC676]|uniref:hypothetical protein n=1 Tax=Sphingomonas sp. JC676 TaxID=2768065 RepID=UPI001657B280|nr:hypothetical protein [Sphingomonas sp. JC676]MBC9034080.1 hypothetical protein [Sphingomonas sp. JC676]
MRILVLALALLPATAMARDGEENPTPEAQAPVAQCQDAKTQYAGKPGAPAKAVRPRTLAQEPLANQYHPVLRRENGCDKPVMIRENVGREQR